jgi:hypothetical protein
MKTIFTLVAAVAGLWLSAQPTITSSIFPPAGYMTEYNLPSAAAARNFNPGASGTNVSWNFSGLDASQGVRRQKVVIADTTMNYGYLPSVVNYAIQAQGGLYLVAYSYLDATKYEVYGTVAFAYSDPVKQLEFPFTYNSQFTDGFSDNDSTRYGSTTVKADAWGTLTLPNGTATNVLRINVRDQYEEPLSELPDDVVHYDVQYYRWYKPDHYNALLEYSKMLQYVIYQGTRYDTDSSFTVAYNKNLITGIAEPEAFEMEVYPNPSTNAVFVSAEAEIETVQISDLSGRLVREEYFYDKKGALNVQDLASGTYYVTVNTTDKRRRTTKLLRM